MFQLQCSAEAQLEISYYNESLAVWEPLIEPVMETEGIYRPWEVLLKVSQRQMNDVKWVYCSNLTKEYYIDRFLLPSQLVRAPSHPMACCADDFPMDKADELDGEVHYLMSRARAAKSDSSETETDSETEMTIIKPKSQRKTRLGSDRSYGELLLFLWSLSV